MGRSNLGSPVLELPLPPPCLHPDPLSPILPHTCHFLFKRGYHAAMLFVVGRSLSGVCGSLPFVAHCFRFTSALQSSDNKLDKGGRCGLTGGRRKICKCDSRFIPLVCFPSLPTPSNFTHSCWLPLLPNAVCPS